MKKLIVFLAICSMATAALAEDDMLRIGYEHHLKIF